MSFNGRVAAPPPNFAPQALSLEVALEWRPFIIWAQKFLVPTVALIAFALLFGPGTKAI